MTTSFIEALGLCQGPPKICIPLTARDIASLSTQLLRCEALPGDLYELRLDYYSGDIALALQVCRKTTKRPLLCTIRTGSQGGEAIISTDEYAGRVSELIGLYEYFQLIDIELSAGDDIVRELTEAARNKGLAVVISQHSFTDTPPKQEMIDTLTHMHELGADLPKLAVSPGSPADLFDLMSASWEASSSIGPVITMSMGDTGRLSRIAGSLTGSCITFGAGTEPSAPGQLGAAELKNMLDILGRGLIKEITEYE